jgi:hypothetical protein
LDLSNFLGKLIRLILLLSKSDPCCLVISCNGITTRIPHAGLNTDKLSIPPSDHLINLYFLRIQIVIIVDFLFTFDHFILFIFKIIIIYFIIIYFITKKIET